MRGVCGSDYNAFLGCSRDAGVLYLRKTVQAPFRRNAAWRKVKQVLRRGLRQ